MVHGSPALQAVVSGCGSTSVCITLCNVAMIFQFLFRFFAVFVVIVIVQFQVLLSFIHIISISVPVSRT